MNAVKSKSRTDHSSNLSVLPRDAANNCFVAKGTKIEGNFRSEENIRLDGFLRGEVHCAKKLVTGPDSRIVGKIVAREAVVMGSIEGNLEISDILQLTGSARVKGQIKAKQLLVEEGAMYNGDCQILL